MAKEDRGFASMDRSKQRDIASKGGKAAHQKGTAHEWTSEEARCLLRSIDANPRSSLATWSSSLLHRVQTLGLQPMCH